MDSKISRISSSKTTPFLLKIIETVENPLIKSIVDWHKLEKAAGISPRGNCKILDKILTCLFISSSLIPSISKVSKNDDKPPYLKNK